MPAMHSFHKQLATATPKTHAKNGRMHDTVGSVWPRRNKKAMQYLLSLI
jgi:hypothetical protein